MTSPVTPQAPKRGSGTDTVVVIAVSALASCLIALIIALLGGGAVASRAIPGLPDPGPVTRWGLPVATTATHLLGAFTVGLLLLAAFLLPSDRGGLAAQARGYARGASWSALLWAAAAAATLVFQVSDLTGLPPTQVLGEDITAHASASDQGVGLVAVVLLATGTAFVSRVAHSANGAVAAAAMALGGILPPALTGHAASALNHELAVTGVALHVVAVCVWVGGLAAVTFHGLRGGGEHAPTAVERFSRLALWAYAGVAVGGTASAATRLFGPEELVTTGYGRILLAKIAVFVGLGAIGWAHRRWTVTRILADGGRGGFVRLAGVELTLMAAVMGLATALARTAPPTPEGTPDRVTATLGFPMPPPISAHTLLTLWRPDLFFIVAVLLLGGLYAAGIARLVRRGDRWPWGRALSWALGLLTLVAMLLSGFGTYSMVLFSTHMIQHMVLSMLTPILLVLGAPVTLALRALRPAAVRGDRGPREWLNILLQSRFSQWVTHPVIAAPLFVVSPYALYFTSLFPTLMDNHFGHLAMNVHFLVTGFLFYWVIIGVDPGPRKLPYLLRVVLLLLAMGMHAFFGITIMMQSAPLAMEYYGQFEVPWNDGLAEDQYSGGGIAWAIGEIPTSVVLTALVVQWSRDEERIERRRERHSKRGGSDDADMDAYNAYLQELDRRAREGRR
ncbi:putative copper resistance protein D [Haloactinospora alba]|uniref:Putative copper resistance protein D n=1 Tax=Haloactinospora alba TaxID=405555 RepID=A0A543NJY8_9ACTN|nr:cytochrome c oxidase assembly protein [Haloactinospora alba]TQN32122.1 putative copper resistance protein D [Haloactinospora alba]